MRDGRSGGRVITIAGGALTLALVVMAGTVADVAQVSRDEWIRGLFWAALALATTCGVVAIPKITWTRLNLWLMGCLAFAGLVVIQGLMHDAAMRTLPPLTMVNVAYTKASAWRHQNTTFTLYYLLFPLSCAAQYLLHRHLRRGAWTSILASAVLISALSSWLPTVAPDLQQYLSPGGRFRGLATSSNSFGLVGYLLFPWLLAGLLERHRPLTKVWYGLCLGLVLRGVYECGSRTATGLWALFIVTLPMLAMVDRPRWGRLRHLLPVGGLLALAVCVTIALLAAPRLSGRPGTVAHRLHEVGQRMEEDGLQGVFFREEARGLHALVAWVMARRAPLAGWGPGGFYREFSNAIFLSVRSIRGPTDSALNHYLMIAGDLGLSGLAVNFFLIVAPLWAGRLVLRRAAGRERLLIRLLLASQVVFVIGINLMPPAYFPDVVWLWTGSLAYLVVSAERHGLLVATPTRRHVMALGCGALVLAAACIAGVAHVTFGPLGYRARQTADWWPSRYSRNCHELEVWDEGLGCWCANNAVIQIPFFGTPPDTVNVQIASHHPDLGKGPVAVMYGGRGGPRERILLRSPSWETLTIPVTEEYLYRPSSSAECRRWKLPWIPAHARSLSPVEMGYFVLSLRASRTWRAGGRLPTDAERELAVAVLLPEWRLGRGCYPAERWKEGRGCWCRPDALLEIPISREPPESVDVILGAFHPDVPGRPLTVEYGGRKGPTERLVIDDLAWHVVRVPLSGEYLYHPNTERDKLWWRFLPIRRRDNLVVPKDDHGFGYFVLSLKTSRGWVPREREISGDVRNLGVAVLLPDL